MIAAPPLRLIRLHLASRRAVPALILIACCAAALRLSMRWLEHAGPWARTIPMITGLGAAVVIGAATWSPIGEGERVTGRHLPVLRLGAALLLSAASVAAFTTAIATGTLPGGTLPVLRALAGLTGLALLTALVFGARQCWVLPLAYTVVCARGFDAGWTSLWLWPARPEHDVPAALVAAGLLTTGLLAIALRGPRDGRR